MYICVIESLSKFELVDKININIVKIRIDYEYITILVFTSTTGIGKNQTEAIQVI